MIGKSCDRVSFCSITYATEYCNDRKIMRQGIMWKEIFRVTLKQWPCILLEMFFAAGYTFGLFFMRQGSGCRMIFYAPPSLP